MERRDFLTVAGVAATLGSPLAVGSALAQQPAQAPLAAGKMLAGRDYRPLQQPAPVDTPAGKIELLEFFWYGCPHCNAFEPVLAQWVKALPADVVFKRVPIAFQSSFVPQQQLFYALEAMGLVDKLHAQVFAAIHRERRKLSTVADIAAWIAAQGVDGAVFKGHFDSFTVAAKVRRATQLMNAYGVEGVPALGVAGRFYTDGELTHSMERALQVVSFLLTEVRAGR